MVLECEQTHKGGAENARISPHPLATQACPYATWGMLFLHRSFLMNRILSWLLVRTRSGVALKHSYCKSDLNVRFLLTGKPTSVSPHFQNVVT